jgi:glycosyltransferase involved in cell wall biosynthesis
MFKDGLRGASVKIAILSSASAGGAGIAAYRIYQSFCERTDCEIDFFDINAFGETVDEKISPQISATNSKITNTHFTIDYASDTRQWVIDLLMDYDAINVQWASYLVSLSEIHELAKSGKKILFTLHDFHYITGGCHYPAGCTGFMKNCAGCPQVNEKMLSQQTVVATNKLKREIFLYANVHLSAPSQFIVDCAIHAGIVPVERAHVLRNAYVPIGEYEPKTDSKAKSILLIADSFDEQRKGLSLAVDSLKIAAQSFRENNNKVTLHLVGGLDREVIQRLNASDIKVITHGHIKDHAKLIEIFKQCEFILSCSYEDNWPNILVEAGSYGCIPIVGKWHGCEEFVNALGLGYVASQYTAEKYAIAINQALNTHLDKALLVDFVKKVRAMHAPKNVVANYMIVFNQENQSVLPSSSKQQTHFSANYLASMQGILMTQWQTAAISTVESPFGNSEHNVEFKASEIGWNLTVGNSKYALNQHRYGLSNFKIKL